MTSNSVACDPISVSTPPSPGCNFDIEFVSPPPSPVDTDHEFKIAELAAGDSNTMTESEVDFAFQDDFDFEDQNDTATDNANKKQLDVQEPTGSKSKTDGRPIDVKY